MKPLGCDHGDGSGEIFSRGTLELTFRVLRDERPSLALIIQNLLAETYPASGGVTMAELPLKAETVARIVEALTTLSENLSTDGSTGRSDLMLVQSLLLDWSLCSQYIEHSTTARAPSRRH